MSGLHKSIMDTRKLGSTVMSVCNFYIRTLRVPPRLGSIQFLSFSLFCNKMENGNFTWSFPCLKVLEHHVSVTVHCIAVLHVKCSLAICYGHCLLCDVKATEVRDAVRGAWQAISGTPKFKLDSIQLRKREILILFSFWYQCTESFEQHHDLTCRPLSSNICSSFPNYQNSKPVRWSPSTFLIDQPPCWSVPENMGFRIDRIWRSSSAFPNHPPEICRRKRW